MVSVREWRPRAGAACWLRARTIAIGRACRDAGVPSWSPHDLRHRRISLLHHEGVSWAEIGASVGQRNLSVTADRYTHAMMDYREIDRGKLVKRAEIGSLVLT